MNGRTKVLNIVALACLSSVSWSQPPGCPPCRTGDLDCDGVVGPADLAELLANWGLCPPGGCPADIAPPPNGDGVVGAADLAELLASWGPGDNAFTVSLTGVGASADCQSGGAMGASFGATYDNTNGTEPASASIECCQLLATAPGLPGLLWWNVDVIPDGSGIVPAGESLNVNHALVGGNFNGEGNPCDYCSTVELIVTWEINGELVTQSKTGVMWCSF